ncbi:hypothetical protein AB0H73_10150 [Streptomyces olivoreticuli]
MSRHVPAAVPVVIPEGARVSWELADRWKAHLGEVRAGRLVLKGSTDRSWRSDEEVCVVGGRECRTSAVAAVLDANGIAASFGGGGYVYAPHVVGFSAGFLAGDGPGAGDRLVFDTLGLRLPPGLERAAPLVLAAARAAVEACCKVTRPRFPGDWSSVTENTGTACRTCRAWLDRTA